MSREEELNRQRGYAVPRRHDSGGPGAVRPNPPRMGGATALPASGQSADLFIALADDLPPVDRAGGGWCVRLGVPEVIPAPQPAGLGYDMQELLAELTITSGGVSHVLEVNAYPGCTLHLAGEQIAAKVKWGASPVDVPPDATLRWQLSRGVCRTTATRGFTLQTAPAAGLVPPFATGFALFSGDSDLSDSIELELATHTEATRVIQHYTTDDLLQVVGQFAALPPGAGAWRWLTATAEPVRLVFCYGDVT